MTAVGSQYFSWSADGHPQVIETAIEVLNGIRVLAIEGFNRVPHGGLEVGGVLFGRRTRNQVRIEAFRRLDLEYAFGPGFKLSGKDEAALETLLGGNGDAELRQLEPVGWYRSRTRGAISLSGSDLDLYRRYFPQSWQIALVVRPANLEPTRAGFFLRERDGSIRGDSSYREFSIEPARKVSAVDTEQKPAPLPPAESPVTAPRHGVDWLLVVTGLAAALVMATVLWNFDFAGHPALSLKAVAAEGQLVISWDRDAAIIRNARDGELEIRDGNAKSNVNLSRDELRKGIIAYKPQSTDVLVRLRVSGASARQDDLARFVGRVEQNTKEAEKPRVRPAEQSASTQQPRELVPARGTAARESGSAEPASVEVSPPAPARTWISPLPRPPAPEPALLAPPLVAPAAAPSPLIEAGVPAVAPPPPPKSPVAPPAPSSGKLIWTGRLPRNAVLTIETGSPSSGTLVGGLPGTPVQVRAYPGELTEAGIELYTDAIRPGQRVYEEPGPLNGWNRTWYVRDPQRAAELTLIETPGARNGWKRLVVKNRLPRLSTIVLEWNAITTRQNPTASGN